MSTRLFPTEQVILVSGKTINPVEKILRRINSEQKSHTLALKTINNTRPLRDLVTQVQCG